MGHRHHRAPHPGGQGLLFVVLHTYSRRVVGWSIDASPTAALITNALVMAIDSRLGQTAGPRRRTLLNERKAHDISMRVAVGEKPQRNSEPVPIPQRS